MEDGRAGLQPGDLSGRREGGMLSVAENLPQLPGKKGEWGQVLHTWHGLCI